MYWRVLFSTADYIEVKVLHSNGSRTSVSSEEVVTEEPAGIEISASGELLPDIRIQQQSDNIWHTILTVSPVATKNTYEFITVLGEPLVTGFTVSDYVEIGGDGRATITPQLDTYLIPHTTVHSRILGDYSTIKVLEEHPGEVAAVDHSSTINALPSGFKFELEDDGRVVILQPSWIEPQQRYKYRIARINQESFENWSTIQHIPVDVEALGHQSTVLVPIRRAEHIRSNVPSSVSSVVVGFNKSRFVVVPNNVTNYPVYISLSQSVANTNMDVVVQWDIASGLVVNGSTTSPTTINVDAGLTTASFDVRADIGTSAVRTTSLQIIPTADYSIDGTSKCYIKIDYESLITKQPTITTPDITITTAEIEESKASDSLIDDIILRDITISDPMNPNATVANVQILSVKRSNRHVQLGSTLSIDKPGKYTVLYRYVGTSGAITSSRTITHTISLKDHSLTNTNGSLSIYQGDIIYLNVLLSAPTGDETWVLQPGSSSGVTLYPRSDGNLRAYIRLSNVRNQDTIANLMVESGGTALSVTISIETVLPRTTAYLPDSISANTNPVVINGIAGTITTYSTTMVKSDHSITTITPVISNEDNTRYILTHNNENTAFSINEKTSEVVYDGSPVTGTISISVRAAHYCYYEVTRKASKLYDSGGGDIYFINGVELPTLYFVSGGIYDFDMSDESVLNDRFTNFGDKHVLVAHDSANRVYRLTIDTSGKDNVTKGDYGGRVVFNNKVTMPFQESNVSIINPPKFSSATNYHTIPFTTTTYSFDLGQYLQQARNGVVFVINSISNPAGLTIQTSGQNLTVFRTYLGLLSNISVVVQASINGATSHTHSTTTISLTFAEPPSPIITNPMTTHTADVSTSFYDHSGVTAVSGIDGTAVSVTATVVDENDVIVDKDSFNNTGGTYTVTYTATEYNGVTATSNRIVTIVMPPSLSLSPTNMTLLTRGGNTMTALVAATVTSRATPVDFVLTLSGAEGILDYPATVTIPAADTSVQFSVALVSGADTSTPVTIDVVGSGVDAKTLTIQFAAEPAIEATPSTVYIMSRNKSENTLTHSNKYIVNLGSKIYGTATELEIVPEDRDGAAVDTSSLFELFTNSAGVRTNLRWRDQMDYETEKALTTPNEPVFTVRVRRVIEVDDNIQYGEPVTVHVTLVDAVE